MPLRFCRSRRETSIREANWSRRERNDVRDFISMALRDTPFPVYKKTHSPVRAEFSSSGIAREFHASQPSLFNLASDLYPSRNPYCTAVFCTVPRNSIFFSVNICATLSTRQKSVPQCSSAQSTKKHIHFVPSAGTRLLLSKSESPRRAISSRRSPAACRVDSFLAKWNRT